MWTAFLYFSCDFQIYKYSFTWRGREFSPLSIAPPVSGTTTITLFINCFFAPLSHEQRHGSIKYTRPQNVWYFIYIWLFPYCCGISQVHHLNCKRTNISSTIVVLLVVVLFLLVEKSFFYFKIISFIVSKMNIWYNTYRSRFFLLIKAIRRGTYRQLIYLDRQSYDWYRLYSYWRVVCESSHKNLLRSYDVLCGWFNNFQH